MSGIFAMLLSATAGGVTPPVVSVDSAFGASAISVEPFG